MSMGSVNVPGGSSALIEKAIDQLKAELISGRITTPLDTAAGETITTASGEDILAVRIQSTGSEKAYTDAAIASAVAGILSAVDAVPAIIAV